MSDGRRRYPSTSDRAAQMKMITAVPPHVITTRRLSHSEPVKRVVLRHIEACDECHAFAAACDGPIDYELWVKWLT